MIDLVDMEKEEPLINLVVSDGHGEIKLNLTWGISRNHGWGSLNFSPKYFSDGPNKIIVTIGSITETVIYDRAETRGEFHVLFHPPEIPLYDVFPDYSVEYADGTLYLGSGEIKTIEAESTLQFPSERYPNLGLREGVTLKVLMYDYVPLLPFGYKWLSDTVALDEDGKGFRIDSHQWEHYAYLFAPLKSRDSALEYVRFIYGDASSEVEDVGAYLDFIAHAREGYKFTRVRYAPVKYSTVTRKDGRYVVERVYIEEEPGWREELVYQWTTVGKSGKIFRHYEYVFALGVILPPI